MDPIGTEVKVKVLVQKVKKFTQPPAIPKPSLNLNLGSTHIDNLNLRTSRARVRFVVHRFELFRRQMRVDLRRGQVRVAQKLLN